MFADYNSLLVAYQTCIVHLGFPGGLDHKGSVCNPAGFDPWVGKIPWEKE